LQVNREIVHYKISSILGTLCIAKAVEVHKKLANCSLATLCITKALQVHCGAFCGTGISSPRLSGGTGAFWNSFSICLASLLIITKK
jgi:hypothetical protein